MSNLFPDTEVSSIQNLYYRSFDIETLVLRYADVYGNVFDDLGDKQCADDPSLEEGIDIVRVERNRRLSETDWTQLSDVPLTPAQKARWATYRQALRDITENFVWNETKWPVY